MAADVCDSMREQISASLDGELSRAQAALVTKHVSTCERCSSYKESLERIRSSVRLQPVESDVPDLTAAIVRRISNERATHWWRADLKVVAVAATATALVLGGFVLPNLGRHGSTASASDIAQSVRAAARSLDGYAAKFTIVERDWHPLVPERTFHAAVYFDAPEDANVRVRDVTAYPSAQWPRNNVSVVQNDTDWTISQPLSCPAAALPHCLRQSGRQTQTIVGRQPFDGATALPNDIVVPLQTLASSYGVHVVGADTQMGRPSWELTVPFRQAAPLVQSFEQGGSWRSFYPLDTVRLWVEAHSWLPLRFQVVAGASPDRQVWAQDNGYSDEPGEVLLDARATSLSEAPPSATRFDIEPRGLVRSGGFHERSFSRIDAITPGSTAGLLPYRAGITDEGQKVLTYTKGTTWLKVVEEPERPSFPFYASTATQVKVGDGWGYYEPATDDSPRRLDIYGASIHIQVETNLPSSMLEEIGGSFDIAGGRLPHRLGKRSGSVVTRIAAADAYDRAAFARKPSFLPRGYSPSAALLSRAPGGQRTLTVYYRRSETEFDGIGIRITQAEPVHLLPSSSEAFVGVRVGSHAGRWSAESGQLEWIDDGVYRSITLPSFDLGTALQIATGLRD
ncbi:MAG: zf-HC2 domain-containing protein [Actinomycetota bacterium]|nr:zf-HC2 domain-containing protein [Actinomycetota bacterium]